MKILIAYYSKGRETEKVAEVIKKEFEAHGHSVDVEKIKPLKEQGFLSWWPIRTTENQDDIQPPKIKDVSRYNLICIGSPNFIRLSLPVVRYLRKIKGLKYKNVGFFTTTAFWPPFEWYIFSTHLLDFTFSSIINKKGGRIIDNILLSNFPKKWSYTSEYGKKNIKNFCRKLETPIFSLKDYFLEQKEIEDIRFLALLFSFFLFFSFIFQIISSVFGNRVFSWTEYFSLFIIGFFTYFSLITILVGRILLPWGKYLAALSMVAGLTITILFLEPSFDRLIVLSYVLVAIVLSLFRDPKIIFFAGLTAVIGYIFLFFTYSQQRIFTPSLDLTLLFLSIGMVGFVAQNLEKHLFTLIETQDEIESARISLEIKVMARTRELRELSESLEEQVKKRTKELQTKMEELGRFNKLAVGRELKMIALKKEIEKLKKRTKKKE